MRTDLNTSVSMRIYREETYLIRKGLAILVIILFIGMVFTSTIRGSIEQSSISTLNGDVLYVGGSGEGNYTKIQDAIDNASDGDTVFVYAYSSPYYERVILSKSIFLIGEDKYSTIIDAEYEGFSLQIHADDCMVSGFTIQNCGRAYNPFQYAVIKIYKRENVTIENNIITVGGILEYNDWIPAIYLYKSSYNIIQGNYLFEESYKRQSIGIMIHDGSTYNSISGNNISGYNNGIGIWSATENESCNHNTLSKNHVHHNDIGIEMSLCERGWIINNRVTNNLFHGVSIFNARYINISGNIVSYNGDGYSVDGGIWLMNFPRRGNNVISNNVFSNNNPNGLFIGDSIGNVITENNFIDNEVNAYFIHETHIFNINDWNGNYWSDSITGGFLPKIIVGLRRFLLFTYLPWINVDWRPAQEPYDIEVLV
jgi:parallel beta-helix repeat protein